MTQTDFWRAKYEALKAANWMFVSQFCTLEGYVVAKRDDMDRPVFPVNNYALLAHWLNTEPGRKLFPLRSRSLRETADELSRYVGWLVDENSLYKAVSRLGL